HEEAEDAEAEQRGRVYGPALLGLLAHSNRLVREHLEPSKGRVQKRALAVEYARHENAHGLRAGEHEREEEQDLQNSDAGHLDDRLDLRLAASSSETLRAEQRVEQVNEETDSRDSSNDVVHWRLLQLVAGPRERPAEVKSQTTDQDIGKVKQHDGRPF